jgi:hypothetical protein
MRSGVMNRLGLTALAMAALVGCKTYQTGSLRTAGLEDDALPPSGRQVINEGGLIVPTDGAPAGGGGIGLGTSGSGTHPGGGWYPSYDAYQPAWDAYQPPGSDGGAGACTACDLLLQNCPGRSACYRSGTDTCCSEVGAVPAGGYCGDDTQCDKGLLCVDTLCVAVCDVNAPRCGPSCKPIGRYPNVGYCAP